MSELLQGFYFDRWESLEFELEQLETSLVSDYCNLSSATRRSIVNRMLDCNRQLCHLTSIARSAGLI